MSNEYRLIRVEDAEELEQMLRRLADVLASSGTLSLPGAFQDRSARAGPLSVNGTKKTYPIGRGSTGYGYVDVVEEVIGKTEFSLDEAWDKIESLIETDGKRPRDSLRTALDRAEEYERFEKNGDIWYRRRQQQEEGMFELN